MVGCEKLFLCQGGVSTLGFFAICYFIFSTLAMFYKGGEISFRDMGILIIASVIVTVARMFVPFI